MTPYTSGKPKFSDSFLNVSLEPTPAENKAVELLFEAITENKNYAVNKTIQFDGIDSGVMALIYKLYECNRLEFVFDYVDAKWGDFLKRGSVKIEKFPHAAENLRYRITVEMV